MKNLPGIMAQINDVLSSVSEREPIGLTFSFFALPWFFVFGEMEIRFMTKVVFQNGV